jgi:putative peptide zinc metalloprotease protein
MPIVQERICMATVTAAREAETAPPGHDDDLPAGLWGRLQRAADAPAVGIGDLWRGLERRLLVTPAPATPAKTASSIFAGLAERINPALYRPEAIPDVAEEQVREGDQLFTVIRSPRGTFLRLTPLEREVWQRMDGTRTVAQLAADVFASHGRLLMAGDLAAALKAEGFLTDAPVGVFRALAGRVAERAPRNWGRRAQRLLAGRTWPIPGLDAFFGGTYRGGGWLLFTRPFFLLWALFAIAGLVAFGVALTSGDSTFRVISPAGSVGWELAALWGALLVSFVLHESAHALAVKHFQRKIIDGGVMLYFGMPAAYVDTSDIWRSPRTARILVSAAGPMADLLLGGLAALAALALPDAGAALAFKFAVACYAATLFNLNPLLEFDGYFILVDLLRMPELRRRSFAFLREALGQPGGVGRLLRAAFGLRPATREERIFTRYGLGAALYAVVAVWGAWLFWQEQVLAPTQRLLSGTLPEQLLGWLLLLVVVVPVLAAALLAGLELARTGLAWSLRRGYGRRPALLAALGGLTALLLAWASALGPPVLGDLLAPLVWMVGLGALLALQPDYRGAALAPAMAALTATTACAAIAAALRALDVGGMWVVFDALAFVFLLLAGFAALLDVDLRLAHPRELIATALLLMIAFAAGTAALFAARATYPMGSAPLLTIIAAPAYFGALALALLLPHLLGLHDSRLVWSWGLLWLGNLAQTAGYITDLGRATVPLDVLAAGLWAAAWLTHLATLRQISTNEIAWGHEPGLSEGERLLRAFRFSYAGCYRLLRRVYGERRARALDDRMDVLSATANWDVTLDHDRARVGMETRALPLDQQGARYAEVLRYVVGEVEQIAGIAFARRAIRAAYDALPWPERETASRLCFPDTPWARELSSAFGDVRASRLRLLRQVDLFLTYDDDDLETLAHAIHEQPATSGTTLLRAGSPAPGVWVVEAGEVIGLRGERIEVELHRGAALGANELLHDQPSVLTYQATVATSLLFLPAEAFRARSESQAGANGMIESVEVLRMLERVPLFASLPRNTLRGLGLVAQPVIVAPRTVVVRQGVASGMFYIVTHGRLAVMVREAGADGTTRQVRQVAQLGPHEFFGELELLRGTPPVASVVSLGEVRLMVLPHDAIRALVTGDGEMARGLERIGSGRLMTLREEPGSRSHA